MIDHSKDGNCLMLADFAGMTVDEARDLLCKEYRITEDEIAELIVVWGDGGSWADHHQIILRGVDGVLYWHEAAHCSCHGFEDMWGPDEVPLEYILGRKWGFGNQDEVKAIVHAHLAEVVS